MADSKGDLEPRAPLRAFAWPDAVSDLLAVVPDPAQVFFVGGCVRDALLGHSGQAVHDLDLATGGDALALARQLGDRLRGAYYPLDTQRGVGRVILERDGSRVVIDVARFRGGDLLADLSDRDFTLNAMAVSLADTDALIDPLGGENDLLRRKWLRLCAPDAIGHDPIRALRAVRFGLGFDLKLDRETLAAVRKDGPGLVDREGALLQPERARDELIKMLAGRNPSGAARLLETLGLLRLAFPTLNVERLAALEQLSRLLLIVSPQRDDNTAANLTHGLAVMVLDRYRAALQEHLSITFGDGRPLGALLALWTLIQPGTVEETAERLRLSNAERDRLAAIQEGVGRFAALERPLTPRAIHRYFKGIGEAGIDAALLGLAVHLAEHQPAPDPERWRALLDEVASPLLDGFFRRHQQVVKPPPLVNGDVLMKELNLKEGLEIGDLLERLLEEQAAGEISTREEALRVAEAWAAISGMIQAQ